MPSIWKRLSPQTKIEEYRFPDADELDDSDFSDMESIDFQLDSLEQEAARKDVQPPSSFADVQAAAMLQKAQEQADELLRQAREEAEQLRQEAKEEGYSQGHAKGYAEGVECGTRQATEEVFQQQSDQIEKLADEVKDFIEKANDTLNQQMEENVLELRDLAISIAEKVIGVSLDSSADVIERMIRMAIEKRKRCEWVQIYVSSRNARRLAEISPVLATSFAALSDHVRIVPMADDEPGACIVETPDEIIDASVSTQIDNIRTALAETPLDYENSMI